MSEFLQEDLSNALGYSKKSGKPKPAQVPVALNKEGQPIFNLGIGLKRPSQSILEKYEWMDYDGEVERQRRLLTDTALAHLALEHPQCVETAVDLVGKAIRTYWLGLRTKGDEETIKKIAASANTRIYGPTSFGRREEQSDKVLAGVYVDLRGRDLGSAAIFKAQIEQWFAPLDKKPRDVPKLMSLYDYFYCKVLGGGTTPALVPNAQQSSEYLRAEAKKGVWRPDWYEKEGPRGRAKASSPTRKTGYPGLLSGDFTIPLVGPLERCGLDLLNMRMEERNRGWDMFAPMTANMEPQFKESLEKHNLSFSASASGTTSTLFLAAEAFANISSYPLEEKKQYLLACVIYLVAGGMHTCHEIFWTGKQVGIDIPDGKYIPALPASFTSSRDHERWSTEFWDIVRPDRATVRQPQ